MRTLRFWSDRTFRPGETCDETGSRPTSNRGGRAAPGSRLALPRSVTSRRHASCPLISALTGRGVDKLSKAIEAALEGWETRISTGKLNAFLGRITAAHPHPVRGGKQSRILFGTQAHTSPPTFALFTSGQLDPGYVRFIKRRLREEFGFVGTPVHIEVRAREKRSK